MSYRYDKEKKTQKFIFFGISIFVLLVLFTPLFSLFYDSLEKPFVAAYTNTAQLKEKSKNIFHTWYSKKKLVEENNKLNQDLKKLEIDNLRLVYLESFLESNTALPKGDDSVLYAKIIKKNNRGTLTINAGQKDDITVGDWAVNTDGTLLGFVDVVYDSSSEIALFNKSNIETQVILFPENVSLTTKGNGNALVSDVPREVNVEIGNIVYSQEKAGFIIGKVSVIDFDPRDPFKRVYVRPINSIQNLQDISIIKKAPNSVIE